MQLWFCMSGGWNVFICNRFCMHLRMRPCEELWVHVEHTERTYSVGSQAPPSASQTRRSARAGFGGLGGSRMGGASSSASAGLGVCGGPLRRSLSCRPAHKHIRPTPLLNQSSNDFVAGEHPDPMVEKEAKNAEHQFSAATHYL